MCIDSAVNEPVIPFQEAAKYIAIILEGAYIIYKDFDGYWLAADYYAAKIFYFSAIILKDLWKSKWLYNFFCWIECQAKLELKNISDEVKQLKTKALNVMGESSNKEGRTMETGSPTTKKVRPLFFFLLLFSIN